MKLRLAIVTLCLGFAAPAGAACLDAEPTLPAPHFTVHDDGTVSDAANGLMWARCLCGLSFGALVLS